MNVKKVLRSLDYRIETLERSISVLDGDNFIDNFAVCMDLEERLDEILMLKAFIKREQDSSSDE